MHSGEEWFQIGWQQYVFFGSLLLVYLILVFSKNLPPMKSFQEFADTINSAGGHIIILSAFSGWFFLTAMRFFFHVLGLPDEVITKNNAVIMTAIAFLTGTAFGGAWGALIKTMSGGKANGGGPAPPVADTLTAAFVPSAEGRANVSR
jgi:hypothetical protein